MGRWEVGKMGRACGEVVGDIRTEYIIFDVDV
jgi:hypothetical protein